MKILSALAAPRHHGGTVCGNCLAMPQMILMAAMAIFFSSAFPALAMTGGEAGAGSHAARLDLTAHWVGYASLVIFVLAYLLVMLEEVTHLRKSKPVILAAGIIWAIIGWQYASHNMPHAAEIAVRHNILEYAELFLFLLVAMTYINAMGERRVFMALRSWMVRKGFTLRQLFWLTGLLSFIISPVADNLTTALLMCAVVLAVDCDGSARDGYSCKHPSFVAMACINIVVGANAGGAFSPFGDITTLMVWQKGIVHFGEFFALFIPSLVNWLVPALIMSMFIPQARPQAIDGEEATLMKPGAVVIILLFFLTIVTAVMFHNYLHLPPMLGMMTGLAYLQFYSYYLRKGFGRGPRMLMKISSIGSSLAHHMRGDGDGDENEVRKEAPLEVFEKVAQAEWDTLLFFFGVVLAVGGLGFIGYLAMLSHGMYTVLGPTISNVMVGVLSAIVDNIPVMFAVLTMHPDMNHAQWLLVTLTAGVGGSLLSIGSAAGVALMGQARGYYTFGSHLKWSWAIALGYAASIGAHMLINGY
jgi:NhaD family Na+/H+ antiporter